MSQTKQTYSWMEDVKRIDSCLTALFISKHQIDPMMQILSCNIGLKRLTMNQCKDSGGVASPWW